MAISASEARKNLFPLIAQVNDDRQSVEIISKAGSAVLMSVISAGVELSQPDSGNAYGQPTAQQTAAAAMAQQLGQTGNALLQKNLNIQPTLEIRPGYRFNVMVSKDIILPSPYSPAPSS